MSATDLLEQMKREVLLLPPAEQERFLAGLAQWESSFAPAGRPPARLRRVHWPDPAERLQRIFGSRVLQENIVLTARTEEAY